MSGRQGGDSGQPESSINCINKDQKGTKRCNTYTKRLLFIAAIVSLLFFLITLMSLTVIEINKRRAVISAAAPESKWFV
jgi:ABC-type arginine transport system permease subunit